MNIDKNVKRISGAFLVGILLLGVSMVIVNAVPVTKLCVDVPCWVGWYGHKFVANVNITDVENLYSFEFKLAWNTTYLETTYLDFVGVNITCPEEWGTNYVVFKNETLENYNATHGRYWLNVSALAPAPSFNGSTILVKVTFNVTYQPFYPEPDAWVCLDIYDTKLSNPEGLPISHEAYDDLYYIPSGIPCHPCSLKVWPDYYEAKTLGENFTVDIYIEYLPPMLEFTSWKAKLGYNTTLLEVLKVEEGSFLHRFRTADKRYFTADIHEEEGYINMTGGILGACVTPFGSGTLARVTFNATYMTTLPTNATCILDLYDTKPTDFVYDGFYQAPYTRITGDVNGDGIVDIFDLVVCGASFGSKLGDPYWNPDADLNGDAIIDIFDLVIVAIHLGEKA